MGIQLTFEAQWIGWSARASGVQSVRRREIPELDKIMEPRKFDTIKWSVFKAANPQLINKTD